MSTAVQRSAPTAAATRLQRGAWFVAASAGLQGALVSVLYADTAASRVAGQLAAALMAVALIHRYGAIRRVAWLNTCVVTAAAGGLGMLLGHLADGGIMHAHHLSASGLLSTWMYSAMLALFVPACLVLCAPEEPRDPLKNPRVLFTPGHVAPPPVGPATLVVAPHPEARAPCAFFKELIGQGTRWGSHRKRRSTASKGMAPRPSVAESTR